LRCGEESRSAILTSEGFSVSSAIFQKQISFPGAPFHMSEPVNGPKRKQLFDERNVDSPFIIGFARIENLSVFHACII
jgi:hypothetical protein